jgi:tRNA-splicing ligase RtcB
MSETYKQLTPYRYELSGSQVPITFHLQKDLFPNDEALEQLSEVANTPGVFHHVAVLSDVHPKKGRKCPTGVAIAADRFLPQTMDTAPNCGMRMFTAPLKYSEVSKEAIDEIFQKLVEVIPTQKPLGTPISYDTVLDICRFGTKGLLKNLKNKWPFLEKEIQNTFQGGSEFNAQEVPDKSLIEGIIPKIFLRMAQLRLGILGMAGNHFLDLMRVDKIQDKTKAEALGIEEDQLVFFMHTGSGILGQYASYFYTPKVEEHLLTKILVNYGRLTMSSKYLSSEEIKKLRKDSLSYRFKKEFFSIDPDSNVGKAYLAAHRASGNFGYANRAILAAKVRKVVEEKLSQKLKWNLIYDMPHIGVRQEKHYGREVWIHRNGVSRANGPSRMKNHPVFSQTGEPCFFAGSMTTPSYLACATDQNESTFFSASHGAGRKKESTKDFNKEVLFRKVKNDGVKLYNAKSKGVVRQYSEYYKNIDEVMNGIIENKIATPVAKLVPIAVLMA